MNLTAIRQGLADLCDTVPGVRAYAEFPDTVATSSSGQTAVVVVPGDPYVEDYVEVMSRGLATARFRVAIVCQRASIEAAQRRVDELLSSGTAESRSLVDVLLTNTPLDGVWHHVYVESATGVGDRTVGDVDYFGADLNVVVRAGRA